MPYSLRPTNYGIHTRCVVFIAADVFAAELVVTPSDLGEGDCSRQLARALLRRCAVAAPPSSTIITSLVYTKPRSMLVRR